MEPGILRDLLMACGTGLVTGLIAWGGLRKDVEWIKHSVKTLFDEVEKTVPRTECAIRHEKIK